MTARGTSVATTGRRASAARATRPKDRGAQISVAAADLFAERGFAATSVNDIAEAVGITAAAIYRHAASKDALLQTLLVETIDAWVDASERAGAAGGAGALERLVAAAVQLVADRPGQLATYLRERQRADAAIRGTLARQESNLLTAWTEAILAANPDLERADIAIRQQAINGVLRSMTRRPEVLELAGPRDLLIVGLVALAAGPRSTPARGMPPSTAWDAPQTRRQQILATAMALFSERGFHGVGLGEVAASLGMSGPSIYEHFATKNDILLDAYDQAGALVTAGAATALERAGSAPEAMVGLIESFAAVCVANVELLAVTAQEGSSLPEDERPRLRRRRRELHETWVGVLQLVRPDLTSSEARLLVRSSFPLIQRAARRPRTGVANPIAITALVVAFLGLDRITPSH